MRGHSSFIIFLILMGWTLAVRGDESAAPPGLPIVSFRGQEFITRTVNPQKDDLQLFLNDDQGHRLQDFAGLKKMVEARGERLLFAANAGMFEVGGKPVGLLVQGGAETSPLNLNDAPGNFYMKPNGVFVLNEKHAALVVESGAYPALLTPVTWATQSGPLLVLSGNIHPDFNVDSKSRKIRSGVGVTKEGIAIFALSRAPVTFYDFASLFVEKLKCPNALFLDGDISAFYTEGMKEVSPQNYVPGQGQELPHTFGPMFGLIEKSK